jgi:hypothetical protein
MRIRRGLAVGVPLMAVAVTGAYLQWVQQKTPFQADYDRVQPGMTVEEVHAILGEPNFTGVLDFANFMGKPDHDYDLQEEYGYPRFFTKGPSMLIPPEEEESAYVYFADGQVTGKRYVRGVWHNPTLWDRIWDRMPWRAGARFGR